MNNENLTFDTQRNYNTDAEPPFRGWSWTGVTFFFWSHWQKFSRQGLEISPVNNFVLTRHFLLLRQYLIWFSFFSALMHTIFSQSCALFCFGLWSLETKWANPSCVLMRQMLIWSAGCNILTQLVLWWILQGARPSTLVKSLWLCAVMHQTEGYKQYERHCWLVWWMQPASPEERIAPSCLIHFHLHPEGRWLQTCCDKLAVMLAFLIKPALH